MASFFDNYRDTKKFEKLKVPSTIFRNADENEETTVQEVVFYQRPDAKNYKGPNYKKIFFVVPTSKTSGYDTYGERPTGGLTTEDEVREVEEANRNRLNGAIKNSLPRVGLVKGAYGGIVGTGEILGAIDADTGFSLTAEGANKLLTDLEDNGYRIQSIQEPTYSSEENNGYYPGDIIKKVFGQYPQRGKVTGSFPKRQDNQSYNKFVKQLRNTSGNSAVSDHISKYSNPFQGL